MSSYGFSAEERGELLRTVAYYEPMADQVRDIVSKISGEDVDPIEFLDIQNIDEIPETTSIQALTVPVASSETASNGNTDGHRSGHEHHTPVDSNMVPPNIMDRAPTGQEAVAGPSQYPIDYPQSGSTPNVGFPSAMAQAKAPVQYPITYPMPGSAPNNAMDPQSHMYTPVTAQAGIALQSSNVFPQPGPAHSYAIPPSNPYGLRFSSISEMDAANTTPIFRCPAGDLSIPTTDQQKQAWVYTLVQAIRNNQGVSDKPSPSFMNRWVDGATYYDPLDFEVVAWEVVRRTVQLHTSGWDARTAPIRDQNLLKNIKESSDWTFKDRMNCIVDLLRVCISPPVYFERHSLTKS
jgi:hypothetical protein